MTYNPATQATPATIELERALAWADDLNEKPERWGFEPMMACISTDTARALLTIARERDAARAQLAASAALVCVLEWELAVAKGDADPDLDMDDDVRAAYATLKAARS